MGAAAGPSEYMTPSTQGQQAFSFPASQKTPWAIHPPESSETLALCSCFEGGLLFYLTIIFTTC